MVHSSFRAVGRWLVLGLVAALLAGCGTFGTEGKLIDYRSARRAPSLEVPPDLTTPAYDDQYKAITASGQTADQVARAGGTATPGAGQTAPSGTAVLPTVGGTKIVRDGTERWLVVEASAEDAWRVTRDFWIKNGFVLAVESPNVGLMETEWAENRAKLPLDPVTRTLSNVIGTAYSTGEMDKFRTRLERGAQPGTTEIYISHRGMQEVATGAGDPFNIRTVTSFKWAPRPPEPELEALFLQMLMVSFGATEEASRQAVAGAAQPGKETARMQRGPDGSPQLVVDEPFDRAWRRVGLALDRTGFTVVDRDRAQGLYFVRFADPDAPGTTKEPSWWSKLQFWKTDDAVKPEQYRIVVTELPSTSVVLVQDPSGAPDQSPAAERIVTLLYEQLK